MKVNQMNRQILGVIIVVLANSVKADSDASTDTSRTIALVISLIVLGILLGLCITYYVCKNFVARDNNI